MVYASELHDTFARRPRLLALAFSVVLLGFAAPASAQSDAQSPDEKAQKSEEDDSWQPGDPVILSDRINLRDNMTLFRFGLGIGSYPQTGELSLPIQLDYRTAISDKVDYRFPLVFSVRFLETDSVTSAVEAGLRGAGYADGAGVLSDAYARLPVQVRFSDNLAVTLEATGSVFTAWGRATSSYSTGGATIFEWSNGDRLQGGFGAELEWDQQSIENEPGSVIFRTEPAHSLLTRVGSVGGPDHATPRPLFQVRIHRGFHLYEASTASFDTRSLALVSHRHVLGFKWYY